MTFVVFQIEQREDGMPVPIMKSIVAPPCPFIRAHFRPDHVQGRGVVDRAFLCEEKGLDSVKTALRVFELVATAGNVGVTELSRKMGVPKSTVQRGLVTLNEAGWIRPAGTGPKRRWAPTTKLLLFSRNLDPLLGRLRSVAREVMEDLGAETRESIHLVVREDDAIVLIERVDSTQALRTVRPLGGKAMLHIVSTGKAMLAQMSDVELDHYMQNGLEQSTPRSIADRESLLADLDRVRERGFGVSDGELELGIRAVGAAIRNPDGQPFAALSISCPAVRLPDSLIDRYGSLVRAAAAEIEALLTKSQR